VRMVELEADGIDTDALAQLLREKYETVLPGYHLNKKHWNTVICSGQLTDQEVRDLIVHSYHLVKQTSDA